MKIKWCTKLAWRAFFFSFRSHLVPASAAPVSFLGELASSRFLSLSFNGSIPSPEDTAEADLVINKRNYWKDRLSNFQFSVESNTLLCFALPRYVIGPKDMRYPRNQSDAKLDPIVT